MNSFQICNYEPQNIEYLDNNVIVDVKSVYYNGQFCFLDPKTKNIYDLDGFHIGTVETGIKIKLYAKPIDILGETYYIDSTDRIYDKTGFYWGHFRDGMLVD